MPPRPSIRVELLSNPLFLSSVRELVAGVAKRLGFSEANCSHLALAVDEALCNVMRHGYDKRTDGTIWVSLWPRDLGNDCLELTLTIEDEAKQVDPNSIKGRDLLDIRPGGLGVHIIREVMDEARYERRDGPGMRLTLVKRQPSAAPCTQVCSTQRISCTADPPAQPSPASMP